MSLVAIAILVQSTAANAEVCDKAVGENWRPEHGPVWLLHPVGFPVGLTLLVGGLALLRITRQRWLGYVALGFIAVDITGILYDVISQHEVFRYEVKEGCRSVATNPLEIAVLIPFSAAFVWIDFVLKRLPRGAG